MLFFIHKCETSIFQIILFFSLQNMNTCFTFLTSAIEESCKLLNIKWILSLEKTAPLNHFELKDTLTAPSTPQTLFLWFANVHETGNVTFKDIFCVVQTSGSTGDQKIIRVPYKCIQSNVESLKLVKFLFNHKKVGYSKRFLANTSRLQPKT